MIMLCENLQFPLLLQVLPPSPIVLCRIYTRGPRVMVTRHANPFCKVAKMGLLCKYIIRTETKISQIIPGCAEISFLAPGCSEKISVVSDFSRFQGFQKKIFNFLGDVWKMQDNTSHLKTYSSSPKCIQKHYNKYCCG